MGATYMKDSRLNLKKVRKATADRRAKALGKDLEAIKALRLKELNGKKTDKSITKDELAELESLKAKK